MKNSKNRWKNYNNKSINYNSTTINYNKKKTQKKKLLQRVNSFKPPNAKDSLLPSAHSGKGSTRKSFNSSSKASEMEKNTNKTVQSSSSKIGNVQTWKDLSLIFNPTSKAETALNRLPPPSQPGIALTSLKQKKPFLSTWVPNQAETTSINGSCRQSNSQKIRNKQLKNR